VGAVGQARHIVGHLLRRFWVIFSGDFSAKFSLKIDSNAMKLVSNASKIDSNAIKLVSNASKIDSNSSKLFFGLKTKT
jgi:hypothetical protein